MKKKTKIGLLIGVAVVVVGFIVALIVYNNTKYDGITGNYIPLTGNNFRKKIENKESFVLMVKQTGCGACEAFEPIYKEVAEENKVDLYSINTSELSASDRTFLSDVANTQYTPTVVFIVSGEEETTLNRLVGDVGKTSLTNRLKSLGYITEE